jgi:hypothetical protein
MKPDPVLDRIRTRTGKDQLSALSEMYWMGMQSTGCHCERGVENTIMLYIFVPYHGGGRIK